MPYTCRVSCVACLIVVFIKNVFICMHFLSNIGGVVDTSQLISLTSLLQGSFLYQINTPFDSMFQLYFYHIV